MIDTVEFRVHDIKLHHALAAFLDRKQSGVGKSINYREADGDDLTIMQKVVHKTYILYHDSGSLHQVAQFNELKSSHYTIAYKIDYLRDFIGFNISIPKYVYGTNIIHYNTPPGSKKFDYSRHSGINLNLRESYRRLYHFFNKFIKAEFGEISLDPRFIEVNRIDLCYNQVFDSKQDAMAYLNQLRKLKKRYARSASNYSRDWQTSIMYKTDRYSFKVYHKGAEFKKNDSKKLRELNETGAGFDVDYYQTFADKVLRYEMTFRNSYMSYLYMSRIFRADCYIWQAGVDLWKRAKAKKVDATKYLQFRASLTGEEKRLIDYVNGFVNKTKNFYLVGDPVGERFDLETNPDHFQQWPGRKQDFYAASAFSPELFDVLAANFARILAEFKLDVKEDASAILSRLAERNRAIDSLRTQAKTAGIGPDNSLHGELGRKINVTKIRLLLGMLEGSTYEEIEASGVFSVRTWANLRKDLKELGVTQSNLASTMGQADFDLRRYNSELVFNSSKFKNLHF